MAIGEFMKNERENLKQMRDELRVQANLGKAELQDAWEGLEKRWSELEGKLEVIGEQAREDAADVRQAAELLIGEIREGYTHLKTRL